MLCMFGDIYSNWCEGCSDADDETGVTVAVSVNVASDCEHILFEEEEEEEVEVYEVELAAAEE